VSLVASSSAIVMVNNNGQRAAERWVCVPPKRTFKHSTFITLFTAGRNEFEKFSRMPSACQLTLRAEIK
jgi:hypothetical protein